MLGAVERCETRPCALEPSDLKMLVSLERVHPRRLIMKNSNCRVGALAVVVYQSPTDHHQCAWFNTQNSIRANNEENNVITKELFLEESKNRHFEV